MTDAEAPQVGFEWAVIRLVPDVHREEFVNVGVLLHARTTEFLALQLRTDWRGDSRLARLRDAEAARRHLEAYEAVARGDERGGPMALRPPSERFHWLTAPRSAVIQSSAVRQGLEQDPAAALGRIFVEQCGP